MSSDSLSVLGYGALIVGGVLLYDQYQKNKQVNTGNHRKVDNKTATPPPTVRTPMGGWNSVTGYFDNWFYGGRRENNHLYEL